MLKNTKKDVKNDSTPAKSQPSNTSSAIASDPTKTAAVDGKEKTSVNQSNSNAAEKPKIFIIVMGGDHTDPSTYLISPKYIEACLKENVLVVMGEEGTKDSTYSTVIKQINFIEVHQEIIDWLTAKDYKIREEQMFAFGQHEESFIELIHTKCTKLSAEDKNWWIEAYRIEKDHGKRKEDGNEYQYFSKRIQGIYYEKMQLIALKAKAALLSSLNSMQLYGIEKGRDYIPLGLPIKVMGEKESHRIEFMIKNIKDMINNNHLEKTGGVVFVIHVGMAHLNRLSAHLNISLKHFNIEVHAIELLSKNSNSVEHKKNIDKISQIADDATIKKHIAENPHTVVGFSQDPKTQIITCRFLDDLIIDNIIPAFTQDKSKTAASAKKDDGKGSASQVPVNNPQASINAPALADLFPDSPRTALLKDFSRLTIHEGTALTPHNQKPPTTKP